MPTYDYICMDCEESFETFHSMNFKGEVPCEFCGSTNTKKEISSCFFCVASAKTESKSKEYDIKAELKDKYGVHEVHPLQTPEMKRPRTLEEIYKETKAAGSYVAETIKATEENSERQRIAKQKEYHAGAKKRSKEILKRKKLEQKLKA